MRNIQFSALLLGMLALSSCIHDESTEAHLTLPTLAVDATNSEAMPIKNFNLGEHAIITPDVQYSGSDSLTYTWSVGTYKDGVKGKMEPVGHERTLNHQFLTGGSYYAHLTVSDGRVGAVRDYQINVNRTFEEGYLLVINDATGRGKLAFVKVMTPEEQAAGTPQITMEHIVERMNPSVTTQQLRGVVHGVITFPRTIHRILASTPTHCYFFDPNTFTITSSIEYDDVFAGFQGSGFYADTYYPFAHDQQSGKFVHLNQEFMFGYEYGFYKGLTFDDCFQTSYSAWGGLNYVNHFVDYATSEVKKMNLSTGEFTSTGTRLAGQDIISVFLSPVQNSSRHDLVLAASKTDPTKWQLHDFDGIEYLTATTTAKTQTIPVTAQTATPTRGTRFVFSERNNRYFYAIGHQIFVFLPASATPLPNKANWAISFAAGEEITYMTVNAETDELYVATQTTSTGRGNFYIFDCADIKTDSQGNIRPKATHTNVADRITQILYKPRL